MKKENITDLMQPSNFDQKTLDSWSNFQKKLDKNVPKDITLTFPLFLLLYQLDNIEINSPSSTSQIITYGKHHKITLQLISNGNLLEDALFFSIEKNKTKTSSKEKWVLLDYNNPYAYIVDRLHWLDENEIKRHLAKISNITIKNNILGFIQQELSESISQAESIRDKLGKVSTQVKEDSKENGICKIYQSQDYKSLIKQAKDIETQLLDGKPVHAEAIIKLKEIKQHLQDQFLKPLIKAYKTPRLESKQTDKTSLEFDKKTTDIYLQILNYAENICKVPDYIIIDWLNTEVEQQTDHNLKLSTQKYLDLFAQSRHVNANIIKFINQILLPENTLLKNPSITREKKESSPNTTAEPALFSENKTCSPTNEARITEKTPKKILSSQEIIREIIASEPDSENRVMYLHYLTQTLSPQENPMATLCSLIKELPEKEDLISSMLDLESRYEETSITCQQIQWLRPWSQLYSSLSEKIINMITNCQTIKTPCEKIIDEEAHYIATFNNQGYYITISKKPQTKIVTHSGKIITEDATKIAFPLTLASNFHDISGAAYELASNIHDNTEKLKALYKNEVFFKGLLQPLQHIIGSDQSDLVINDVIDTWNDLIKPNTTKKQHKKRKKKAKKNNKASLKTIPWLTSQTKLETQAIHELIKTALPLKKRSEALKELQSTTTSGATTNVTETETVFMITMQLYRCARASQKLLELKQAEKPDLSFIDTLEIKTRQPTDTNLQKPKATKIKPTSPAVFPTPSKQCKRRKAEMQQELKLFSSLYLQSKIRTVKNTMAYTLITYKSQAQELAKAYEKDEKLLLQKIQEGQQAIEMCESALSDTKSQLSSERKKTKALKEQNQKISHQLKKQQEKLKTNKTNHSILEKKLKERDAQKQSLSGAKKKVEQTLKQFRQENACLKNNLTKEKQKNQSQSKALADLKTEIKNASKNHSTLQTENKDLEHKINALKKEIETLKQNKINSSKQRPTQSQSTQAELITVIPAPYFNAPWLTSPTPNNHPYPPQPMYPGQPYPPHFFHPQFFQPHTPYLNQPHFNQAEHHTSP